MLDLAAYAFFPTSCLYKWGVGCTLSQLIVAEGSSLYLHVAVCAGRLGVSFNQPTLPMHVLDTVTRYYL